MGFLQNIKKLHESNDFTLLTHNSNKYRVLIKEQNGLTAYYSSCPIYRGIDNRLIRLQFKNGMFFGSNGVVTVQEENILFKSEKLDAYLSTNKDIEIRPTYNGVLFSVTGSECVVTIRTEASFFIYENIRCFALMEKEYQPVFNVLGLFGKRGEEIIPLKIKVLSFSDYEYKLKIESEEKAERIEFEANLYVPKLMLDTTVERSLPDSNNVYGGIAFLGDKGGYCEQELYSRINGELLNDLYGYELKTAKLYLPKLSGNKGRITAYKLGLPWCTLATTWNNKIDYSSALKEVRRRRNYEIVDVTEIVGEILLDFKMRDTGALLSGEREKTVVSTGDSCAYPQILQIKLKNK